MRRALVLIAFAGCRGHFDRLARDASGANADVSGDATDALLDPGDARASCAMTATAVPTTGAISGQLAATNDDDFGSCGGSGIGEAVYSIDVPAGAQLLATADESGTTADTTMYIRTTCADPATEVVCDVDAGMGDNSAWRLTGPGSGRTYVFVDGATAGQFVGRIQTLLPLNAPCSATNTRDRCGPGLACVANTCAVAACALADSLTGANTYTRTAVTTSATNLYAGACGAGNDGGVRAPEVIYQLILPSAVTNVRVSTDSAMTDYDTLIYMHQFTCNGAEVGCDDDKIAGAGASQFDTGSLPAGDYYVFVDGFGTRSGTAVLTITITP